MQLQKGSHWLSWGRTSKTRHWSTELDGTCLFARIKNTNRGTNCHKKTNGSRSKSSIRVQYAIAVFVVQLGALEQRRIFCELGGCLYTMKILWCDETLMIDSQDACHAIDAQRDLWRREGADRGERQTFCDDVRRMKKWNEYQQQQTSRTQDYGQIWEALERSRRQQHHHTTSQQDAPEQILTCMIEQRAGKVWPLAISIQRNS